MALPTTAGVSLTKAPGTGGAGAQPSFSVKLPTAGSQEADQAAAEAGTQQDAAAAQQQTDIQNRGDLDVAQAGDSAALDQQRMAEMVDYADRFQKNKADIDERDRQLRAKYEADPEGGFKPGVTSSLLGLIGGALQTLGTGQPHDVIKDLVDTGHQREIEQQGKVLKLLEMNGADRKDLEQQYADSTHNMNTLYDSKLKWLQDSYGTVAARLGTQEAKTAAQAQIAKLQVERTQHQQQQEKDRGIEAHVRTLRQAQEATRQNAIVIRAQKALQDPEAPPEAKAAATKILSQMGAH
jgi:hypothetical protein